MKWKSPDLKGKLWEGYFNYSRKPKLGYQHPTPNTLNRLRHSDAFFISFFLYFLIFFLLFSLLMTVSANRDEHSCLFAFFPWNLLQLHSLNRHAFVTVNWLPLLMKYNFVFFHSIIDTLVQIITVLTAQLCWNHLTDTEWRNCLRCQHRTDYYRRFKMFYPKEEKNPTQILTACQGWLLR